MGRWKSLVMRTGILMKTISLLVLTECLKGVLFQKERQGGVSCQNSHSVLSEQTLRQHGHTYDENSWQVSTAGQVSGHPCTRTRISHGRSPGSAFVGEGSQCTGFLQGNAMIKVLLAALWCHDLVLIVLSLKCNLQVLRSSKQDQSACCGEHLGPAEGSLLLGTNICPTI